MGNKNLILVVGILLLWFMMIRPLSKKSEKSGESGTVTPDSGALTPASSGGNNTVGGKVGETVNNVIPTFQNSLTRTYTN